jgi:RNA polymerase sigma-70 factor (ECF subfamily)
MDDSDAALVTACRRGDREAFNELVQRHRGAVYGLAYRLIGQREEAEDLAQEAFLAAYEKLDQLADAAKFGRWLLAITRNACRMWWRQARVQPSLEPLWDGNGDLTEDSEQALLASAREEFARRELQTAVRAALAALSPDHRAPVQLHYLEGYDYRETAVRLDLPVSTVRGRLERARRELRKELWDMAPTEKEIPKKPPITGVLTLNAADLAALRSAADMAWANEEKPIINSVYFTEGGLVATDTHRLLRYHSPSLADAPEVIVEAALARALRDEHLDAAEGQLTFTEEGAELTLADGTVLTGACVQGDYPHWHKVVPEKWTGRAVASVKDWLDALHLLQRLRDATVTTLGLKPDTPPRTSVTLSSEQAVWLRDARPRPEGQHVQWDLRTALPALITLPEDRPSLSVGANFTYLEQAIRALGQPPEELIELRYIGPLNPFVFRPVRSDQVFVVTMPMQIDGLAAG